MAVIGDMDHVAVIAELRSRRAQRWPAFRASLTGSVVTHIGRMRSLTYAENLSQSSLGYGSSRPLGTEEVRPPAPLEVADDKARRTAIHLVFKRAPLGQLLSSRMDYDGRLVVEARRA